MDKDYVLEAVRAAQLAFLEYIKLKIGTRDNDGLSRKDYENSGMNKINNIYSQAIDNYSLGAYF